VKQESISSISGPAGWLRAFTFPPASIAKASFLSARIARIAQSLAYANEIAKAPSPLGNSSVFLLAPVWQQAALGIFEAYAKARSASPRDL
jgi:hypothetical protein